MMKTNDELNLNIDETKGYKMSKQIIDDVVICFDSRNINREIEEQIKLLNIPYTRKGNVLIVDYDSCIVHIHFMTIRMNIDGYHFKHIKISEIAATELNPDKLCRALSKIQHGRVGFENYPKS
ncbi:hypothetical protein [Leuconostoc gasicomitatum]|uniref:hypothetical protein n=1 Tax=Leuconostoc gasicomitatum TaxID=115778 RepID=UPI001CC8033B|nr:hypothetical protein [Leuconostoc gasicomitatum]MBZ5958150.1 hypothetical protein [Leuconostoc gasicomitatum]